MGPPEGNGQKRRRNSPDTSRLLAQKRLKENIDDTRERQSISKHNPSRGTIFDALHRPPSASNTSRNENDIVSKRTWIDRPIDDPDKRSTPRPPPPQPILATSNVAAVEKTQPGNGNTVESPVAVDQRVPAPMATMISPIQSGVPGGQDYAKALASYEDSTVDFIAAKGELRNAESQHDKVRSTFDKSKDTLKGFPALLNTKEEAVKKARKVRDEKREVFKQCETRQVEQRAALQRLQSQSSKSECTQCVQLTSKIQNLREEILEQLRSDFFDKETKAQHEMRNLKESLSANDKSVSQLTASVSSQNQTIKQIEANIHKLREAQSTDTELTKACQAKLSNIQASQVQMKIQAEREHVTLQKSQSALGEDNAKVQEGLEAFTKRIDALDESTKTAKQTMENLGRDTKGTSTTLKNDVNRLNNEVARLRQEVAAVAKTNRDSPKMPNEHIREAKRVIEILNRFEESDLENKLAGLVIKGKRLDEDITNTRSDLTSCKDTIRDAARESKESSEQHNNQYRDLKTRLHKTQAQVPTLEGTFKQLDLKSKVLDDKVKNANQLLEELEKQVKTIQSQTPAVTVEKIAPTIGAPSTTEQQEAHEEILGLVEEIVKEALQSLERTIDNSRREDDGRMTEMSQRVDGIEQMAQDSRNGQLSDQFEFKQSLEDVTGRINSFEAGVERLRADQKSLKEVVTRRINTFETDLERLREVAKTSPASNDQQARLTTVEGAIERIKQENLARQIVPSASSVDLHARVQQLSTSLSQLEQFVKIVQSGLQQSILKDNLETHPVMVRFRHALEANSTAIESHETRMTYLGTNELFDRIVRHIQQMDLGTPISIAQSVQVLRNEMSKLQAKMPPNLPLTINNHWEHIEHIEKQIHDWLAGLEKMQGMHKDMQQSITDLQRQRQEYPDDVIKEATSNQSNQTILQS